METYIKKEIQNRENFDKTTVTDYDRLLTAEELSREMKKAAMDRKRKNGEIGKAGKIGKAVETGIFTKTAKFLGKLKIINF